MKDFIINFEHNNSFPLIEQIKHALVDEDPTKLYTFYLDFNHIPAAIKKILFELKDFASFSKQFSLEVRKIIAEHNNEFYEKIKNENFDMKVRFRNFMYDPQLNEYKDLCRISDINSTFTHRFVVFKGVISTILSPKIKMKKIRYECVNCKEQLNVDFNDSSSVVIIDQLKECSSCGEKNPYRMIHVKSNSTDSQTIFIEELSNESEKDAAVIEVLLDGDKVNQFNIGDTVVVSGNVRLSVYNDASINQFKKKLTDSKFYNMLNIYGGGLNGIDFEYIIECNNIEKIDDSNILFNNLSDDDKKQILELSTHHDIVERLVSSFCPTVYGHEIEKEAQIYQLIGGIGRSVDPAIDKRGEINILHFGDPSTAKTELMLFSLGISHKSRFADGGGMSKVGLTGGVIHSGEDTGSSGNWRLTAGTAVIVDGGMLGVDELNDAKEEVTNALKEIMEKQTSTITKVKTGSFKSRISVIACCNPPNGGNYDKNKNFNENLGINVALLSRFDGIFLFRDKPNPEKDEKIAEKILQSYTKNIKPAISRDLLGKYIYYMKTSGNVPDLPIEVQKEISHIYKEIRSMDVNYNSEHIGDSERRSITTRQLESIIRFATARARLLNKKEVDLDDVQAAKKIIMYMLDTVSRDVNTGDVDIGILSGKSSNDMSRDEQFFDLLGRMADSFDNKVDKDQFIAELHKQSKWKDDPVPKIDKAILKYETQQYISIMNNNISLSHYVNNNHRKNQ